MRCTCLGQGQKSGSKRVAFSSSIEQSQSMSNIEQLRKKKNSISMIFKDMEVNARGNIKDRNWLLLESKNQGWRRVAQGTAVLHYKVYNVI